MSQTEELQVAQSAAERLVGDLHPLAACLASPEIAEAGRGLLLRMPRVRDRASLRAFLGWYREELLLPVEMPSIRHAWGHFARYEPRELIALDLALARAPEIRPFAAASRAVGRSQLRRLLPMRDQRLVQRYYRAVESGRANGWHVLVYGVVLGLFSLPLHQGTLTYARQTMGGFIGRAAGPLRLRLAECDALLEEASEPVAGTLRFEKRDANQPPTLLICR
ncbi:MAG: hypothetical protein H7A46_23825 [Verrucomicrobiales bacterium]|nr:hypothetical protein [Verrucomicrobiales bacterium]